MTSIKSTWEQSLDTAYSLAEEELRSLTPQEVAKRAGVRYHGGVFLVPFLGRLYRIQMPQVKIEDEEGGTPSRIREILILHYLIQATGDDPGKKWVDFRSLPGGMNYYPVFKRRIIDPLVRLYGGEPEGLLQRYSSIGGRRVEVADVAVLIPAFPKVEVVFGLWRGDEEFPPRGVILFQEGVTQYLSTEDAIMVCQEILFPSK